MEKIRLLFLGSRIPDGDVHIFFFYNFLLPNLGLTILDPS